MMREASLDQASTDANIGDYYAETYLNITHTSKVNCREFEMVDRVMGDACVMYYVRKLSVLIRIVC